MSEHAPLPNGNTVIKHAPSNDGNIPIDPAEPELYNKAYGVLLLRALDLLLATFVWRDYGVTISAQTGLIMRKLHPPLWARVLNRFLNMCEPNHCELAIACDRERAKLAIAILDGRTPP